MILYNNFFRQWVLRKKNDLMNPRVLNLGELELPRESLLIYQAKHQNDTGPSNTEPLISTYPDQVNIGFVTDYVTKVGKVRKAPFDYRSAIRKYRDGHFKYRWARNPATAISRKQELFVQNLALGQFNVRYMLNRFTAFDKAYNQLWNTIDGINDCANKYTQRQLFLRIELPPSIPSYIILEQAMKHYLRAFDEEGNLKEINDQAIKVLKGYGAFWIMDWYLFLRGDLKHSQFGRLNEMALERLHFVFTYEGRTIILKPGLIKTWLDEISNDGTELTPQRINVVKRILLMFINLVKNTVVNTAEADNNETATNEETGGGTEKSLEKNPELSKSEQSTEEDMAFEYPDLDDLSDSRVLADILKRDQSSEDVASNSEGDQVPEALQGDAPEQTWISDVDDRLLEEPEIENLDTGTVKRDSSPAYGVERALEQKARSGALTVSEQEFFLKQANRYREIVMENGQTLEEYVKIDPAKIASLPSKVAPEIVGLADESMRDSRVTHFKNDYPKEFLDRDIASMILAVQKAGVCLTDLKTSTVANINGSFKVWEFNLHHVDGSPAPRRARLPIINEDGTYTIDGKKRTKSLQRMDKPVRKLDDYRVGLSSYYGRKIIVNRNTAVANNRGYKQSQQIRLLKDVKYAVGNVFIADGPKVPRAFSNLATHFSTITKGDFHFNFDLYKMNGDSFKGLDKLANLNRVQCGTYNGKLLTMDGFGGLTAGDEFLGTVEDVLGLDSAKLPVEFAEVNISGFKFPVGVVLSYYMGIDKLLSLLKITPRTVPMGERPNLTEDEFALTFADEYLIFNSRDPMSALVFGGMAKLENLRNFNRFDLNGDGVWVPLMGNVKVKPRQFDEMTLLYDMFIDPITAGELRKEKYPEEFDLLLVEAVKLLTTDYHRHEVEIEEQRLVGYETFAGIFYQNLVNSVRQFRNKPKSKRNTIDLNPEAIIMQIITDTATDMKQDVNPIHELKDQEQLTFGGTFGRNDQSMVRRTRGQLPTYQGIVSEAGKDSGKAGYVTYTTSNPKIADFRGNVDTSLDVGETGIGSVTMNLMYGANLDAPVRTLYSGVQMSQATSAVNYQPNMISTGYDRVIAHRTSQTYSFVAKYDGKVTKVGKQGMEITYADGSKDGYALGVKLGEAAGEIHRHHRVTDRKVGYEFKAGEVLGWDDVYLARDLYFNPTQVVWRGGINTRLMLRESQFTFEDSLEIYQGYADASKTSDIKPIDFYMTFEEGLVWHVGIGSEVAYDTILCTVEDSSLLEAEDFNEESQSLERFGMRQIKSDHYGKILKFELTYNGDVEMMSPSLKAFVEQYNRELTGEAKLSNGIVKDANVGGNLNVKEAPIEPGTVHIKVYIENYSETVTADKFVVGNQMKGTVGNIFSHPIRTVDGRNIDMVFSLKSLFNRMVLSLRNKLVTNEMLIHVKDTFIRIYRTGK